MLSHVTDFPDTWKVPALPAAFPPTKWEQIQAATDSPVELETVCGLYWYPLYCFARRRGATPEHAEDQVQGFLASICHKSVLSRADRARGRFRSFLLTAFTNFTIREHHHGQVKKRGGGICHIDITEAERSYSNDCSHDESPERLYVRSWATTVLDQAVAELSVAYASVSKADLFDSLLPALDGDLPRGSVAGMADRFAMSQVAIRQEAFRLRQRYRRILRQVVARSLGVDSESQIDEELRFLQQGLS
jgi:DNA-directed RNA polymerase specialized sigma24 family protein